MAQDISFVLSKKMLYCIGVWKYFVFFFHQRGENGLLPHEKTFQFSDIYEYHYK